MLRPALAFAAHLLWPARCAGCDVLVPPERGFCAACAVSLLPITGACIRCALPFPGRRCARCTADPWPSLRATAAFAYGGAITDAILRFKHGGRGDLARPLGRALLPLLQPELGAVDVIVPVPLHPRRLRARGFNQALELVRAARAAAPHPRAWPPVRLDALRRIRDTPALGHLSPAERRAMIAGAFAVPVPQRIRGRRVLVLDDVMTTGATLTTCARALLEAGATCVSVAALARAL
jgi:ComF family protein